MIIKPTMIVIAVATLAALPACSKIESDSKSSLRTGLTYSELTRSDAALSGPVNNALFLPAADSGEALQSFSATITIAEQKMQTSPAAIEPPEIEGKKPQLFPAMQLQFVSYNGRLVPLERGIMVATAGDSFWQMQVAPGRVWLEPGDQGMSRASFPFILTSIIENETYNGVATFLYDAEQVSKMRYQIVQQTTPYLVQTFFEAWGQLPIGYEVSEFKETAAVKAQYDQELADAWPVYDWSELASRHGEEAIVGTDAGIEPGRIATSGIVIDGEIFVKATDTPYGEYPYPNEMRHGVWSVTKTAVGLVTILRLAQVYGDEIFDLKIKDYLSVTAKHDGWDEVTFGHALSMATGIGTGSENTNPNYISDGYITSDQQAYDAWYLAPSNADKQEHLFQVANHPWGPGEHARYRDRDIYVLAAALDAFLKSKEGPKANLWNMMQDQVYGPIGIHHMPQLRTKESDGSLGVPFLAWGLYMTVDDVAKIGTLLLGGGRHKGEQLLSHTKLAEALYQTDIRGLPTGASNEYGDASYHMTLWHFPYRTISGKMTSVGHMHGWGGNVITLIPNGMIGFRFGNGGYVPVEGVVPVADRVRPFDSN
jgi:CubicO group peptidase (beta-lactamase class C family)